MEPTIPLEPSPADVRYDRWMARFKLLAVFCFGLVTGVVSFMTIGDSRYVRRAEFDVHEKDNSKLEANTAVFATRDDVAAAMSTLRLELASHSNQPGHTGVKEELSAIREKLATVQADVTWLKERERRKSIYQ